MGGDTEVKDGEKSPEEKKERKTRTTKPKGLTLSQKLLEIRKSVDYLQKSAKGGQFNYTSSSQVLAAVRSAMNEQGVLLIASVTDAKLTSTPNRNEVLSHFTELWMNMKWVDTESAEFIDIPWYGQGVDLAGEKGVGKALTYAEKYFILKQFNIPTDKDDPDAFQDKNLPQVDVKAGALKSMGEAKTKDEITALWNANEKLKMDKDFIKATKDAGARVAKSATDGK